MARDIRTTLKVDGEQAYNRAIKEASKSISQMGSALTLATSEFQKDGDAMKLMESRSKILRAEIAQQEQIVKSLEGALKDVTEQFGENSKEAEKWQSDLNRAKAKLNNLEAELSNNEKGLDKNGNAFVNAGEKAKGFASNVKGAENTTKGIKFIELHTAIDSVTSKLSSAIKTAVNVGKRVTNIIKDSGKWADDLGTMSLKTGLSVEELQAWGYAAEFAETDIETIVKAMDKLANPSEDASKAMRSLGIHAKEAYATIEKAAEGAIDQADAVGIEYFSKDRVTILWETIDAMRAMVETMGEEEAAVQLEAIANELFGKSFRDILPLIKQGKDGWDALTEEAKESGLVMSGDGVKALNDYYDSTQRLEMQIEALKHTISAELAPGMQEATKVFTELVQSVNEWAKSDEGRQALTHLSDAIASVFDSITQDNFSGIVETAAGAVKKLSGAFGWISEHGEDVAAGIQTIGYALALLKVSDTVISFFQLIKGSNWGIGGSKASETTSSSGSGSTLKKILPFLAKASPYAIGAAVALTPTDTADDQWDSIYDKNGNVTAAGKAAGLPDTQEEYDNWTEAQKEAHDNANRIAALQREMESAIAKYIAWLNGSDYRWYNEREIKRELLDSLNWFGDSEDITKSRTQFGELLNDLHRRYDYGEALTPSMDMSEILKEYIYDNIYQAINEYDPETNALDTTQFFDSILMPLIQEATSAGGITGDSADAIADLIYDKWIQSLFDEDWEGTTDGILNILQEAIEDAQKTAGPDAENSGEAVSQGVAYGIDAGIPAAVEAAGRLAAAVNNKLRSILQIASPSKVTKELGHFVGIGFAEGIDEAIGAVEAATGRMAVAATGRGYGFGGGAGAAGGTYSPNYARTMNIQNYYQRSDADIDALMEAMDQEARYERRGRGAW